MNKIIDNRKYGQVRLVEHNDGTFEQISILYSFYILNVLI